MIDSITMKETATLRFVRKLVGFHLMTVLQQKWVEDRPTDKFSNVEDMLNYLNDKPLIEEWRDVPVEQE